MYYALAGLVFLLFWSPTIIGYARHVPNQGSVLVLNAFLGWTVIGWVVALALAARTVPSDPSS